MAAEYIRLRQSPKAYVKKRITLPKEYWSKSGRRPNVGESRKLPIQLPNKLYRVMSFSDIKNGDTLQVRLVIKFEATIAYEL